MEQKYRVKTKHRLYGTWYMMIDRCNNTNHKSYYYYGARGVSVCDRWIHMENFIEDMYPTYQKGLLLDRIDGSKGYSKDNCRWATRQIQSRNTRKIYNSNTSGYRGVSFYKNVNKFTSRIMVNSKSIFLGYFNNAIDGAIAYNQYVINNNLEHTLNEL